MAMIIITHDMGVVAETADEIAVMYAGQIVEQAGVIDPSSTRPEHPYTEALLGALPQLEGRGDPPRAADGDPGPPAGPHRPAPGLPLRARCPYRTGADRCADEAQDLREIRRDHWVRSAHPASERTRREELVST